MRRVTADRCQIGRVSRIVVHTGGVIEQHSHRDAAAIADAVDNVYPVDQRSIKVCGDRVIQPQPALLHQPQYDGGGERLGDTGYTKAVIWGQRPVPAQRHRADRP
jgi:hypothetical protein